ncbi:Transglutaminase-like protein [Ascosphaera apis ARSEF 7405]|uniref:Transglutaminase-like protein n=1 Tax=Ascosphaera apis ARSEF 7405 TaxID=392613 RepID=A0A168A6Q9_9EURO|nr:Transglutaminase-like protein [Ascosphaera apis ARSEF 7405]
MAHYDDGIDDSSSAAPLSLRDRIAALNSQQSSPISPSPSGSVSASASGSVRSGPPPIKPKPKPALPGKKPVLRSQPSVQLQSTNSAGQTTGIVTGGGGGGQAYENVSPWANGDGNGNGSAGYIPAQSQPQEPVVPALGQPWQPQQPSARPPSYDTATSVPSPMPSKPALPPRLPPRSDASNGIPQPAAGSWSVPPQPSLPPRFPPRSTTASTPSLTVNDAGDYSAPPQEPVTPRRSNTAAAAASRLKSPNVKGRGKGGAFKGAAPGEAKRVAAPAWGEAVLPPLPPKKTSQKDISSARSDGGGGGGGGGSGMLSPPRGGRDSSATTPSSPVHTFEGGGTGRGMVIPPVRTIDSPSRSRSRSTVRSRSPAPPPPMPSRSPIPSQQPPYLTPAPSIPTPMPMPTPTQDQSEYALGMSRPAMARMGSKLQNANVPPSLASSPYGQDIARAKSAASFANQASSVMNRAPPGMVDSIGQQMGGLNLGGQQQQQQQQQMAPPPVPVASKPPIPMATKPNMNAPSPVPTPAPAPVPTPQSQVQMQAPVQGCMTCRDFSAPDQHAARYPRETLPTSDLAWLATELTAPFPSPTDKARALFTWMHHNIYYDVNAFFGGNVRGMKPEDTFASGLAVCDGYSGLYMTLAQYAGLECRKLSGHGKGYGYRPLNPGEPLPQPSAGHAWNAVRIDGGEWKLIDSTWGAGHVNSDKTYSKSFHEDYFTMSNEEFSLKHFPLTNGRPAPDGDFYFSAGMKPPTWEQYIQINPDAPTGVERPVIYSNVKENHGIGKFTIQPGKNIDVSTSHPQPIRFQFALQCPHWSLQRHTKKSAPYVFIFIAKGPDGNQSEYIPFNHWKSGSEDGSGDMWYADVEDPRVLGPPGNKLVMFAVTSFGEWKDARGLTREEFLRGVGKVGMGFQGVLEWKLV